MAAAVIQLTPAVQDRALRASEARYRRLFETAEDGILLLNPITSQIEDVNLCLIKMLGYSHVEFLGKKLGEAGAFTDVPIGKEVFIDLQGKGYVRYENLPLRTKDGASINVEFVANSYDCEGVEIIQCNIHDVTDRKVAESQARRHAGLYAARGECNSTMMRCTTEEELFPEICRIAVQLGGAKMTWVGLIDAETGAVRPVTSWGDDTGYLTGIQVSAKDDTPFGTGPIGQAIRGNQPVWLEDFINDPRTVVETFRSTNGGDKGRSDDRADPGDRGQPASLFVLLRPPDEFSIEGCDPSIEFRPLRAGVLDEQDHAWAQARTALFVHQHAQELVELPLALRRDQPSLQENGAQLID